jgi:uncharacterized protein YndB with AHSA1/START domain
MRFLILLALAGVLLAGSPVKVVKQTNPEKALIFEVTIPAPSAEVWKAFSTSEGLATWLAPVTTVDLRPGGAWTAGFAGGSTGGGTILAVIPEHELTLAAMAPDRFPTVRAQRTTARFEFRDEGSSTVVRLVQTGWKPGREWDEAYEYLAEGNAQLLEALCDRFISGPIHWPTPKAAQ